MREGAAGGWKRFHNEEHHDVYVSPDIIRVVKSSSMSWEEHVARMGEMKS
jgi:hypothetical protein